MKLTVVTVKQPTSVDSNGLENCVQVNSKDLSGIAIMKMKLLNTVGKQSTKWLGSEESYCQGKQVNLQDNQRDYIFFEDANHIRVMSGQINNPVSQN